SDRDESKCGTNRVSARLVSGAGTPQAAAGFAAGAAPPWTAAAADLNGDGKLDIATVNRTGSTMSVLLNNGFDGFSAPVSYATGDGTAPEGVAVADFNGDGKLDVVTANPGTNDVSVFLGNGDGTFGAATRFASGSYTNRVATGDFNNDGKVDLVVSDYYANAIGVLLGNGDGTFGDFVNYTADSGTSWVVAADFNKDGNLDVAATSFNNGD